MFTTPESTLSTRACHAWNELKRIGGDKVDELLLFLLTKNKAAADVANTIRQQLNESLNTLMNDLAVVYNASHKHTQTMILQAVARDYTLKKLQTFGSDISRGQHSYAKKTLQKNNDHIIPPQKPTLPMCKRGLEEDVWHKGNTWMINHSTEMSSSIICSQKSSKHSEEEQFLDESAWDDLICISSHDKRQEQPNKIGEESSIMHQRIPPNEESNFQSHFDDRSISADCETEHDSSGFRKEKIHLLKENTETSSKVIQGKIFMTNRANDSPTFIADSIIKKANIDCENNRNIPFQIRSEKNSFSPPIIPPNCLTHFIDSLDQRQEANESLSAIKPVLEI
ncbi:uncharacterized protein MONOS_15350 [Monocercomonoides exilis]|uniref:uncharacterized protein n=1 Tax=Monocercomonoides exilis TaxID=2049356 RepID=UPI0035594B53|nr:hypothetical protein MONOS_15350 [Monocercomonoides exilis]|eukprot:MONOS_15350.1-p1 / transcript=MONOS_15350.1 / gene=MONOS_15350 / organism=Monocercomonoides_exilis_PA203 / gene_product=unspecified product / transcript_product=unspecified product / location=Mono_scaffold01205:12474-13733(-) / protein_length=339 / sequence_SO=supercontig / SO=protein_coding / is_pseudo=false